MSTEENSQEDHYDLSQLEAALAALAPRAERLNRDRLMFLAGQASAEARLGQALVEPAGAPRRAGWFWPATMATMTAIAGLLLVALVVRPAPQVTGPIAKLSAEPPTVPSSPVVATAHDAKHESAVDSTAVQPSLPDWLAWGLFSASPPETKPESSYLEVRNQVLLHGLEPWGVPTFASAAAAHVDDEPIPSCGELNRWLKQEGVEKALRRLSTPSSRTALGAKS